MEFEYFAPHDTGETSSKVHRRIAAKQTAHRRTSGYTAPMTPWTGVSRSLRDVAVESAVIPARAVSLLFRHLPQLVTVICLGLAARQAVIWLAVSLSTFSSLAASLVMPLAPLLSLIHI